MTPDTQRRISYWLDGPFDEATKAAVGQLQPQALTDAFFCKLSFGTGGLRALMGVGTNRLNIYTIRFATQGLANYLKKTQPHTPLSVVIGFDSRHHSAEFALEAARVLAGNKIRVHLLSALRPTPYLSFACRFKHASAGIMITASHNPKEYNGYKVYWSDGAQVVSPHDEGIEKEIQALELLTEVHLAAKDDPLIEHVLLEPLDQAYLNAIAPLQQFKEQGLDIVYTSLHGTGITLIPRALKEWGFSSLHLVDKQVIPDGDFPTVPFPNPESSQALQLGIEKLQATKADILLASDPDADRIGAAVLHNNVPTLINGHEMAALCVEYLCTTRPLTKRSAFVTTVVTTPLLKAIVHAHHATLVEVLTGFKYIGEKIHQWETEPNSYQFVFGAEESYGYLLGTHARDKDAIISACLIAEMALHAKLQGYTLIDRLHHIYKQYGIYREKQASLNFEPGEQGMKRIATIMNALRNHPPTHIGNSPVLHIEDYQHGLHLPAADMLRFDLTEGAHLIVRPSGTEPKLKIYGSVSTKIFETITSGIQACDIKLQHLITSLLSLHPESNP